MGKIVEKIKAGLKKIKEYFWPPTPQFKWPEIKWPKPKVAPWKRKWPKPKKLPPSDKKKYKKLRTWIINWEEWDKIRPIRDQLEDKINNWNSFDIEYQDDFVATVEDTFAR